MTHTWNCKQVVCAKKDKKKKFQKTSKTIHKFNPNKSNVLLASPLNEWKLDLRPQKRVIITGLHCTTLNLVPKTDSWFYVDEENGFKSLNHRK